MRLLPSGAPVSVLFGNGKPEDKTVLYEHVGKQQSNNEYLLNLIIHGRNEAGGSENGVDGGALFRQQVGLRDLFMRARSLQVPYT